MIFIFIISSLEKTNVFDCTIKTCYVAKGNQALYRSTPVFSRNDDYQQLPAWLQYGAYVPNHLLVYCATEEKKEITHSYQPYFDFPLSDGKRISSSSLHVNDVQLLG